MNEVRWFHYSAVQGHLLKPSHFLSLSAQVNSKPSPGQKNPLQFSQNGWRNIFQGVLVLCSHYGLHVLNCSPKKKNCWKFTPLRPSNIRTDFEKCSIVSLAHQWSEWVPGEWESKQLIKTSNKTLTVIMPPPVKTCPVVLSHQNPPSCLELFWIVFTC